MVAKGLIRASEVGQYTYCARVWWLDRVQGLAPTNDRVLTLGGEDHGKHGRMVADTLGLYRWALVLASLATVCLALAAFVGGR